MFRREQVWPVLGSYDIVRKAADTEFYERITAALPGYGIDLPEPLLWYRVGEDSLSRSEFRASWRHSARMLYQSAWAGWHQQIRLGASPRLDRAVRSFPAPHRFRLDQSAPPDEFDLVVLGDWRGGGNAARDALEWIRLVADDGARIALVHAESLNFDGRRPPGLMESVQQLVNRGTVEAVPWDDPVKTGALVIIEPEVLEYLPDTAPGARTPAVVVLLDEAPRGSEAIADTEAIIKTRWDSRVVWSPRGAAETSMLGAGAAIVGRPFPSVMPRRARRPLHRAEPVVVVTPVGVAPEVLDDTAAVSSALAGAGLDVRVRLAAGVRQAIRARVGTQSPRILWEASTTDGSATATAVATDLIIIGPSQGIDVERLTDDARIWGVRAHHRSVEDRPDGADDIWIDKLVERIATGAPSTEVHDDAEDRAAAEAAVRSWFERVSALT
jgi:hypothetical protein